VYTACTCACMCVSVCASVSERVCVMCVSARGEEHKVQNVYKKIACRREEIHGQVAGLQEGFRLTTATPTHDIG